MQSTKSDSTQPPQLLLNNNTTIFITSHDIIVEQIQIKTAFAD